MFETLKNSFSAWDMFMGRCGGSVGEVSALLLLLGGVFLLIRKVITWQIPVAYIATVAILTLIAAPAGISGVDYMVYNVFGGGLMLGAIFMATDYVTSPTTRLGKLIYGVGLGVITCGIRFLGNANEGVSFAILLMNLLVPYIDAGTRQAKLGIAKPQKGGSAK